MSDNDERVSVVQAWTLQTEVKVLSLYRESAAVSKTCYHCFMLSVC